jgi:hypothetical protein
LPLSSRTSKTWLCPDCCQFLTGLRKLTAWSKDRTRAPVAPDGAGSSTPAVSEVTLAGLNASDVSCHGKYRRAGKGHALPQEPLTLERDHVVVGTLLAAELVARAIRKLERKRPVRQRNKRVGGAHGTV